MRTSLHLDLGSDSIFDHPRHNAGEMVTGRAAHRRFRFLLRRCRHESGQLPALDDALPTRGPDGRQAATVRQPAHAVDTDAKQLRHLADLVRRHWRSAQTLALAPLSW